MKTKIPRTMLPIEVPNVLGPGIRRYLQNAEPEEAEQFVQRLEVVSRFAHKKNEQFLKNAMFRISLCAFLNGLMKPFGRKQTEDTILHINHYSWCPSPYWTGNKSMEDYTSS